MRIARARAKSQIRTLRCRTVSVDVLFVCDAEPPACSCFSQPVYAYAFTFQLRVFPSKLWAEGPTPR